MPVSRFPFAALRIGALTAVVVCLSSCGRGAQTKIGETTTSASAPGSPPGSATNLPRPSPTQITLERTACFGRCPRYRVVLTEDGTVAFEGKEHVDSVGRFTGRVAREKVAALARLFEEKAYFSLDDRYVSGEARCRPYASDMPNAITSISLGGRTKRVEHDPGCPQVPAQLSEIEAKIDETAETWRWTGRRANP